MRRMKQILLVTLLLCSVNTLGQKSISKNKRYKVRVARCMKGTNFKDLSLAAVTQTLKALNCVIDTNSFMKNFLISEGHPDCKETLGLLEKFKGIKPGVEQEYGILSRTIKNLKESQCDLKDEYAIKMKKVAITYFEESEARSNIKRVSVEVKELLSAMEPLGKFNIYKAKADSYLLKYMQRGIEFKKSAAPKTKDEEKYVRLCQYKEEYEEKKKIIAFRSILGELLGKSEDNDPNVYKYKKHGLEFIFDDNGNLTNGFFLPDRVLTPCYQNKLKGRVNKSGYLGHILECYKSNANLALCDKKYCEKVLGTKVNSITLCQDYFDKVFLQRREVFGNDFDVMTGKASPLLSKCLITNTMLLYCDSFINSYTQEQIDKRIKEINQGYELVGLENRISKKLCRNLFESKEVLTKVIEDGKECKRAGYRIAAPALIR
jgi:hypothetical protein